MKRSLQALRELEDAWLAASPRAAHTLRAYRNELNRLGRFLHSRGRKTVVLDAALLERFWQEITRGAWHETTRNRPSANSLNQSRRILSAFVGWLVREEHAPVSVLAAVARWRTPAANPSAAGKSMPSGPAPPLSRLMRVSTLDGAAAAFCFWAGATPSELALLATADVDLAHAKVTLTQRTGRNTVAIPRRLARSLQPLLVPGQRWMFRLGAEPPTPAAMAQRVSRWLASLGAGEVGSARALRDHFQRHARARGWNSDEIRSQLRRPSLPPPALVAPSHRRLESLAPASP